MIRSDGTTIYDVAREANVSIKTVSRVLNRSPNVATDTRDRVLEAIEALSFTPNTSARSLAGSRSFLLALLINNPSAAYVADLQLGASRACREAGYHLVVEPFETDASDGPQALATLLKRLRVDGLILSPPICDDPGVLDRLDAAGAAYVRIAPGRDLERADRVEIDDETAARRMTEALLGLGHRRIAFISGPPDHVAAMRRRQGHLSALAAAGAPEGADWVRSGDFSFESGRRLLPELLAAAAPTAIFAGNDDMALGVMAEAQRLGLRIGRDLSVAGFDDSPTARFVWPALSSVRQPVAEMARIAADLLIARPSGAAGPGREVPPVCRRLDFGLELRASTGPAPGREVG